MEEEVCDYDEDEDLELVCTCDKYPVCLIHTEDEERAFAFFESLLNGDTQPA